MYKTRSIIVTSNAIVAPVNTADGRFTRKMSFRGKDATTGAEQWFNCWANKLDAERAIKNQAPYITAGRIIEFSESNYDAEYNTSRGIVRDFGTQRIK